MVFSIRLVLRKRDLIPLSNSARQMFHETMTMFDMESAEMAVIM